MFDGAVAMRFQRVPVERARKYIATGAREQILVPLAVCQRIENVPDAGNVRATKPLEIKKIDAGENRIERDRSHLRNPASDQNVSARTRQHVQAGKERHLIERKHQHTT